MALTRAPDGKKGSRWLTIAVVIAILVITLRPVGSRVNSSFNWCIGCSEFGTLDLIYNIALFAPLGLLLGMRGVSVLRALFLSALLSSAIEFLQVSVIPGRDPSFSDVLANSLGGAFGVPLARTRAFFADSTRVRWRLVAWGAAATGLAGIWFGSWAMAAPVPVSDYYVQWLPRRVGYAYFPGDLRAFAANGVQFDSATLVPAQKLPRDFFDVGPDAHARLTSGGPMSGLSYVARLTLEYAEFLMLGRQNDALVVRYRTHAPLVGLRSPIIALGDVFREDPKTEIEVRAIKRNERVELRATRSGSHTPYAVRHDRITAARVWSTLLPFERGFGSLGLFGDVLWMALLAAPAAYAGARGYSGVGRFLPVAVEIAALALFAVFADPTLWWWPVWLGVALGGLGGFSLGLRRDRERPATLG
jgi:hypothetical protein